MENVGRFYCYLLLFRSWKKSIFWKIYSQFCLEPYFWTPTLRRILQFLLNFYSVLYILTALFSTIKLSMLMAIRNNNFVYKLLQLCLYRSGITAFFSCKIFIFTLKHLLPLHSAVEMSFPIRLTTFWLQHKNIANQICHVSDVFRACHAEKA